MNFKGGQPLRNVLHTAVASLPAGWFPRYHKAAPGAPADDVLLALLQDLCRLPEPVVLNLDTYEDASADACRWVEGQLLSQAGGVRPAPGGGRRAARPGPRGDAVGGGGRHPGTPSDRRPGRLVRLRPPGAHRVGRARRRDFDPGQGDSGERADDGGDAVEPVPAGRSEWNLTPSSGCSRAARAPPAGRPTRATASTGRGCGTPTRPRSDGSPAVVVRTLALALWVYAVTSATPRPRPGRPPTRSSTAG